MDEKTAVERRDTLEKVYDKLDAEPASVPPVVEAPPAEPVPEAEPKPTTDGKPRDEHGRFAKATEKAPEAPPETKEAALPAPQPTLPGVEGPPPTPAPEPEVKAPASWRASERELWSKIPKEARDPILRREKETTDAIGRAEAANRNWTRFQETVRPYEFIMRMNGTQDPLQSVENLLRTAAVLQTGGPQQSAATVAQIMQQFNIDPGMVAAYLEGQAPSPQAQQAQFRDPRLDQLLATIEQSKKQQDERKATELTAKLEEFGATHEYFEDVRDTMADIVDTWEAQGKVDRNDLPGTIQRAYDYAVLLNEDVAKVLKQKEARKAAEAARAAAEKSKLAASSVKNSPASAGGTAQPNDRRSIIAQRYDELTK